MDEPEHIKVPRPEMTEHGKLAFATEIAFNALLCRGDEARANLPPARWVGVPVRFPPHPAVSAGVRRYSRSPGKQIDISLSRA